MQLKPWSVWNLRIKAGVCTIPFVAYGMLLGFATVSYFKWGNWPRYNHPDPKLLELGWLRGLVEIGFLLNFLSWIGVPLLLSFLLGRWRFYRVEDRRRIVCLAGVFVLGVGIWLVDVNHTSSLASWLMD